ncbi:hypothetical protein K488DRAFT_75087 [Vararia minispora EC-137]|uniref:Uncharacterized protein n=1 Tax=Vararia minispora EC-137 TaxID=1314806 RepID=A0ACB8Q4S1_9AGAM|nr:hypothetical protein K488DRAFT_75087 [Vararia minispora EC-137]
MGQALVKEAPGSSWVDEQRSSQRSPPLPDERPRQSVANLIGRFEQQTKKQAPSNGHSSRPSSVVSHTTGDSAKEEAKIAREWPPVQTSSLTRSTSGSVSPQSSNFRKSMSFTSPPTTVMELPESVQRLPITPDDALLPHAANGRPTAVEEDGNADTPTATRGTAAPSLAPATPIAKAKSAAGPRQSVPAKTGTPTRVPIATTKSTPARTPAPPAPKSTATSSRPKTPSRAKTPSGRPSMGSRPPITSPPRAKTPSASTPPQPTHARTSGTSSHLYAPTASSLARSRNMPPVPSALNSTPKKAPDLSRLSKPTAASASKARTAVAAALSPPRGRGAAAKRGVPATRGAAGAGRGTVERKAGVAGAAAAATIVAAVAGENGRATEEPVDEHHETAPDAVNSEDNNTAAHEEPDIAEHEEHVEVYDVLDVELVEEPAHVDSTADPRPAAGVSDIVEEPAAEEPTAKEAVKIVEVREEVPTDAAAEDDRPRVRDDLEDINALSKTPPDFANPTLHYDQIANMRMIRSFASNFVK